MAPGLVAARASRGMSLDWPLSREEKKGRLLQLFESEARASDALLRCAKAEIRRMSGPAAPSPSADGCGDRGSGSCGESCGGGGSDCGSGDDAEEAPDIEDIRDAGGAMNTSTISAVDAVGNDTCCSSRAGCEVEWEEVCTQLVSDHPVADGSRTTRRLRLRLRTAISATERRLDGADGPFTFEEFLDFYGDHEEALVCWAAAGSLRPQNIPSLGSARIALDATPAAAAAAAAGAGAAEDERRFDEGAGPFSWREFLAFYGAAAAAGQRWAASAQASTVLPRPLEACGAVVGGRCSRGRGEGHVRRPEDLPKLLGGLQAEACGGGGGATKPAPLPRSAPGPMAPGAGRQRGRSCAGSGAVLAKSPSSSAAQKPRAAGSGPGAEDAAALQSSRRHPVRARQSAAVAGERGDLRNSSVPCRRSLC